MPLALGPSDCDTPSRSSAKKSAVRTGASDGFWRYVGPKKGCEGRVVVLARRAREDTRTRKQLMVAIHLERGLNAKEMGRIWPYLRRETEVSQSKVNLQRRSR